MDIGDLLFLIFIAVGVLSSLLGRKKKKHPTGTAGPSPLPAPPRPAPGRDRLAQMPGAEPPEPRQRVPEGSHPPGQGRGQGRPVIDPADAAAAREAGSGHPATPLDHFERILKELGIEEGREAPPTPGRAAPPPPPARPPVPPRVRDVAVARPPRPAPSRRREVAPAPPPRPVELAGARHEAFHEQYVKPLDEPARVRKRARARIRPTHTDLREAVLWREILGPPKGLE
jgi:hypothetical protein